MNKLKLVALCFLMLLTSCSTEPEDSDDFDADVICPAEGTNAYGMPNRGTFVDERDGQEYRYTTIGNQVWMAENLRYNAENSFTYDCGDSSCMEFGRYYSIKKNVIRNDIKDAELDMDLIDTVCPHGWHVPSKGEWSTLFNIMGGDDEEKICNRLKSSEKKYFPIERNPAGSDICRFEAIPSGYNRDEAIYTDSYYLTSTQQFVGGLYIARLSTYLGFSTRAISGYSKTAEYPIRCIKD